MELFNKIFGHKKPPLDHIVVHCCNSYNEHEQLLIDKVIDELKTHPENFSARWSSGISLDKSIRSNNYKIQIFYDGTIMKPIEPVMTEKQKEVIKNLINPIFKRDSIYLISKL